jgi:glycosyltransferase involved in cell wall biosynthesis
MHNGKKNVISDKRKFVIEEYDGVPFVHIRTDYYESNGKSRIRNMLQYAFGLLRVKANILGSKPDVIIASSVHPFTWISGFIMAKRYRSKFIAETRDLWPETLISMNAISTKSVIARVLYLLEKFIYTKADHLIFTMPGGEDYVHERGISNSNITYINNGIDIESFEKNVQSNEYNDNNLDDSTIFKVVYTGSIGAYNGVDYLVEAAKIISERGLKDIKILIWGSGPLRESLMQLVDDYKLDNIVFNEPVEKKYIPSILSKSDLNLLLGIKLSINRYGLSPNKLFDYMAAGKPVISNRTVNHDIVKKYNIGDSIEDESAYALAEKIIEYSQLSEMQYKLLGENALKASKDFDFKVLIKKLEKIIETI